MRKLVSSLLLAAACGAADQPLDPGGGKNDSSAEATVLDFEWDGELVTDSVWNAEQTIRDQLLYTIGSLNGHRSVGRLDRLALSSVKTEGDGQRTKVTYHAKMPVAWGSKTNLPERYEFVLPRDVSYQGSEAFTTKYKASCVDFGAHDVDAGSMWYYYRPETLGCRLADADVVRFTASATVSATNTTGKYPEYHKVWEDGALKVVAIFGKYEDGATTSDDAGIDAYNDFVAKTKTKLGRYDLRSTPSVVPSEPGTAMPDITFVATLEDGRQVEIVALLVDNVREGGSAFEARYEALSTHADLIAYNGHAGLGQNVRALARKGQWVAGQYVIVFMNGCDTFAYVDGSLAQARAAVNPDDPMGTRYMEFVTNGMPAFFSNMSAGSWALIGGLLSHARPETYERMFSRISSSQVVLVTGEEDNVYVPGYDPDGTGPQALLDETTSVDRGEMLGFATAELAPGSYNVVMAGVREHPGGDADLYVKVGAAPTETAYDCRPYLESTEETCEVTLSSPGKIFASVNGYSTGTTYFHLTVLKE